MSVYYNDNDAYCCAWLENLMDAGLIPAGDVDDRDIREVKASELEGYGQCHFFAGIGGWAYALQLADWAADRPVWTGSPPCQDNSIAHCIWGKRRGLRGARSGLAHVWLSLVETVRPAVVFFENVPGIKAWLAEIEGRLEVAGYSVSRQNLSAASVGAPHLRRRMWLVADRDGTRLEGTWPSESPATIGEAWRTTPGNLWRSDNSGARAVGNGFPNRVAAIRSAGNAIVPQVAAKFVRAYMEAER